MCKVIISRRSWRKSCNETKLFLHFRLDSFDTFQHWQDSEIFKLLKVPAQQERELTNASVSGFGQWKIEKEKRHRHTNFSGNAAFASLWSKEGGTASTSTLFICVALFIQKAAQRKHEQQRERKEKKMKTNTETHKQRPTYTCKVCGRGAPPPGPTRPRRTGGPTPRWGAL